MTFFDLGVNSVFTVVDTAAISAAKWARSLSVSGSVRLVTCGDRSLTHCMDRDVTDAQLSA